MIWSKSTHPPLWRRNIWTPPRRGFARFLVSLVWRRGYRVLWISGDWYCQKIIKCGPFSFHPYRWIKGLVNIFTFRCFYTDLLSPCLPPRPVYILRIDDTKFIPRLVPATTLFISLALFALSSQRRRRRGNQINKFGRTKWTIVQPGTW